jgi:2'-5' RNA ligase
MTNRHFETPRGAALYTLAYPRLEWEDMEWINEIRRRHDPRFGSVAAHFTLVFGCSEIDANSYLRHVKAACRAGQPIPFVCRYCMPGMDGDRATIFLVPDEGYSRLSLLHDALYRDVLARQLRLDLPFFPHITLGSTDDRSTAKRLCDELNQRGIDAKGVVDALTVAALDGDRVIDIETYPLGEPAGS